MTHHKHHHHHHHRHNGVSHFVHHLLHPKHENATPAATTAPSAPHTVNEAALKSEGFNSRSIGLLRHVDGKLERLVEETGRVLRQEGLHIEMQITQGFRTAREQLECYKRGASKCDGYRFRSNHQSGRAIDYSLYQNGEYLTGDDAASEAKYSKVAAAFKTAAHRLGYNIEWGGDWRKFKDNDHIEIARRQPTARGPAMA